jgi:hypothetical protein
MTSSYDIPIFYLNYTRPHNSKIISEILQTLNPSKFYIGSDFPPENNKFFKRFFDIKLSSSYFNKISNVNYVPLSNTHKDAFLTILESLEYVFKYEEELIFLENDTIPNLEFFKFVQQTKHLITDGSDLKSLVGFNLVKNSRPGYFKSFLNVPFWGIYFSKKSYLELLDFINKDLLNFDFNKILNYFSPEQYPLVEHFFKATQTLAFNKTFERFDIDTATTMFNIHNGFKTLRSGTSLIKYNGFDEEARSINYINSFYEAGAAGVETADPSLFNFDFQGDFINSYFEDPDYEQLIISDFINLSWPGFIKYGKADKF